MKKLGLIINPIAGMGGSVGLKGTDGEETLKRALELGAAPRSPGRACEALKKIAELIDDVMVITYPGDMGEDEAKKVSLPHEAVGSLRGERTTAEDTKRAAVDLKKKGVDLILFAGGDGTARDILDAVGQDVPVLGIPTGVKMHSAVFGLNPTIAGKLAAQFLSEETVGTREAEVMDIDEEAFRQGAVSAKLYGYLRVPYERDLVQGLKSGSGGASSLEGITRHVVENMEDDVRYIVGPGTTTRSIMRCLDLEFTLLGVDVVENATVVALDANESQLLELIRGHEAKIIVTPIGGQGYIFGRGNQQISADVIRRVGADNIIVISTKEKLLSLPNNVLLVDTGDEEVDDMLSGFTKVVVGYGHEALKRVDRSYS